MVNWSVLYPLRIVWIEGRDNWPPGLKPRQNGVPVKPFPSGCSESQGAGKLLPGRLGAGRVKDPLRPHFRALRDAVPARRRQQASFQIAERLTSHPRWHAARAVLLYASFGSEVDTSPLIEAAREAGKEVALPRVEGKRMTLHQFEAGAPLVPNRWGIPEPAAQLPEIEPKGIDLVVVPGLAFDRRGGRLGYGGGYYDRLLATANQAFRVGIAMTVQVVESLPSNRLDAPMDILVTEMDVHVLPKRTH